MPRLLDQVLVVDDKPQDNREFPAVEAAAFRDADQRLQPDLRDRAAGADMDMDRLARGSPSFE
jgi:hypothetical protein